MSRSSSFTHQHMNVITQQHFCLVIDRCKREYLQQSVVLSSIEASSLAVTDVNGDGNPDLIVNRQGENDIAILLNTGNGTFSTLTSYSTGFSAYSIVVGDVNGDDKPEIVWVDRSDDQIHVRFNNGNGRFGQPITYPVGENPLYVAVADVNGDDHSDIKIGRAHV